MALQSNKFSATIPSFSTTMIPIPINKQTITTLAPTVDGYVQGGAQKANSFASAAFLQVGTSTASDHSLTSASYVKFDLPSSLALSTIERALFPLTLELAYTGPSASILWPGRVGLSPPVT